MRSVKLVPIAVIGLLFLAACAGGPREGIGTVAGAVAGGVIGNQFGSGSGRTAATAAGAVVGALLGNQIGAALDEADRQRAADAQLAALRTGTPQSWSNPNTGRYGQVVPGQAYTNARGTCREYTHTVYIDGRPQVVKGVACLQQDGTWQMIS